MQKEDKNFLLRVWMFLFFACFFFFLTFLHNAFLYTTIEEKVILCFSRLGDVFFQDLVVSSIFRKLCVTLDCSLQEIVEQVTIE